MKRLLISVVLFAGCSENTAGSGGNDCVCEAGFTCVDGACSKLCGANSDCAQLDQCCLDTGVCGCDAACLACNPETDSDGDGVTDIVELEYGLDPGSQDSDGDGIP